MKKDNNKLFVNKHNNYQKDINNTQIKSKLIGKEKGKDLIYLCTTSYNAEKTINSTIGSVLSQEGDIFIRYHIQDANSNDNTLEIIKYWDNILKRGEYKINCKNINFTYTSESDEGIYFGLTKGFSRMNIPENAIMTYINADDILLPGAFATMSKLFRFSTAIKWVIPQKLTFGEKGALQDVNSETIIWDGKKIAEGNNDGKSDQYIQQEGIFWEASLFKKVGGFDLNMKFAADYCLWVDFAKIEIPTTLNNRIGMWRERKGNLSSDVHYQKEVEEAKKRKNRINLDSIENNKNYLSRTFHKQKLQYVKDKYHLYQIPSEGSWVEIVGEDKYNLSKEKQTEKEKGLLLKKISEIYIKEKNKDFLTKALTYYKENNIIELLHYIIDNNNNK